MVPPGPSKPPTKYKKEGNQPNRQWAKGRDRQFPGQVTYRADEAGRDAKYLCVGIWLGTSMRLRYQKTFEPLVIWGCAAQEQGGRALRGPP